MTWVKKILITTGFIGTVIGIRKVREMRGKEIDIEGIVSQEESFDDMPIPGQ